MADGRRTSLSDLFQRMGTDLHDPDRLVDLMDRRERRDRPDLAVEYVPPKGPVEELLAAIWAHVLGVDRVGARDDFFWLGGQSLLATQMLSRAAEAFAVELPLRSIFDDRTLAALARRIEEARGTAGAHGQERAEPLRPLSPGEEPVLSSGQERLWFLAKLDPRGTAYNMPFTARLEGRLEPALLARAMTAAVARHQGLRTAFPSREGRPRALVCEPGPVPLPVVDLSGLREQDREGESGRLAERDFRRPFDLARGPLLRASLVRLGPEEHLALLDTHHIVSDGWSTDLLMRDLAAVYERLLRGREPSLPELGLTYAAYARWQRKRLAGGTLERELGYWRETLSPEPPPLDLPTDRPWSSARGVGGGRSSTTIPGEDAEALWELCRREGVTPFMALLAAFQVVLGRLAGQDDVTVGTPVAGRNRPELEGVVGLFLNTLALRTDLSGDPTFRELLARVREVVLGAFAHQEVPFEKLVEELRPRRNLARNPLFDVLINLVNVPWSTLELPGLTVSFEPPAALESKFALSLHAFHRGDALELRLTYRTALFDRERAESLLEQVRFVLEQVAAAPDRRIGSCSLVTSRYRDLLPDPAARLARPVFEPVPATVEAVAEAAPDRIAVRSGAGAWSYRELVARSRAMAAELWARSRAPGEVTAVSGTPSFGLMVGLLGVLRSGGIVLPIDPGLPAPRRRTMLGEAGARTLVAVGAEAPEAEPDGLVILELDPATGELLGSPAGSDNPPPFPGPEDPAYVFFTSGTTGAPKGILGRHDGLAHFLDWQREAFELSADDRSSQLVGLSFDVMLRDVFLPLTLGAVLCLPGESARPGRGAARTLEWLLEQGVTTIHTTPSLARTWLAQAAGGEGLPALRLVFFAGEPLAEELVRSWRELLSGRAELINLYGPTEATLAKVWYRVPPEPPAGAQPVGRPLPQTQALVLSPGGGLCGVGELGEVVLRTPFLTAGYLDAEGEQAARFHQNPFGHDPEDRVYRTGDLGRYRPDGLLELRGRLDGQVKVRGVRVEPAEVEAVLTRHPEVEMAAVTARKPAGGDVELVAYVVAAGGRNPAAETLRESLRRELPEPLVPGRFVLLDSLPLTATGKLDRRALPDPEGTAERPVREAPRRGMEQLVARVWQEVLGVREVSRNDGFFDLGGHSLKLVEVHERLRDLTGADLDLVELFRHTTVAAIARRLEGSGAAEPRPQRPAPRAAPVERREIAVVGMAGRFPGAADLRRFWENLRDGIESRSVFDDRVLEANGVPRELLRSPRYVKAGMILEGIDLFDAELFGLTPLEARLLDPQHRLLLEGAWEALESAGYDPRRYPGRIGLFAGMQRSSYLVNLYSHPELVRSVGDLMIKHATDKDYMVTRVSHKLGLRGPSVDVQTACSTALVAVHLACQSLLTGDSDMVLAGGVTVRVPQERGYEHRAGGILSPDGHCRAFDAQGRGTIFTNGMGLVVLKRLDEALEDGDTIRAVIRGTAVNNDGAERVGYTAPGVAGQVEVITGAQRAAGVSADSISYVEGHGTATELGDPIEVAALTEAFRGSTSRTGFCALGSVKTNVGHLDTAAGIGGFIKTVLALEHRQIPPSLHFETPNPKIGLESSPFYVNTELVPWERKGTPRLAGVSSFGMGGTNAHAIVEEAPPVPPSGPSRACQLLVLSAAAPAALDQLTSRLADHLAERPEDPLADIAFTLQVGRTVLGHRRALVVEDREEAVRALRTLDRRRLRDAVEERRDRPVAFLFPGQGSHEPGVGEELFREEPQFRAAVDRAAEILTPELGLDLRTLLFPREGQREKARRRLGSTRWAQPALFVLEHALATLWMEWGVRPVALLGHSLGEYVAACLAGVLSLEEALLLVARRARLMAELPAGAMVAVAASEEQIRVLLEELELAEEVSVAAVNAPELCTLSGPTKAVEVLGSRLTGRGVAHRPLRTSHAFHSAMVEPVLGPFGELLHELELHPPDVPWVSGLTGSWIRPDEATDPAYWVEHARRPVRFADGLSTLAGAGEPSLLEVGPGQSLVGIARRHPSHARSLCCASLPRPGVDGSAGRELHEALARLWLAGVPVDWPVFHGGGRRRRVPLPTYPFQRRRHWVERRRSSEGLVPDGPEEATGLAVAQWLPSAPPRGPRAVTVERPRLLFRPPTGIEDQLVAALADGSGPLVEIVPGRRFRRTTSGGFELDPAEPGHLASLIEGLQADSRLPAAFLYLWSGAEAVAPVAGARGLVALAGSLATASPAGSTLWALTRGLHAITGEPPAPEVAPLLGACRTIPRRFPGLAFRWVDHPHPRGRAALEALARRILAEAEAGIDPLVVYGPHGQRWVQHLGASPATRAASDEERAEGRILVLQASGDEAVVEVLRETLVEAGLVLVSSDSVEGDGDRGPSRVLGLVTTVGEESPGDLDTVLAGAARRLEGLRGLAEAYAPRFCLVLARAGATLDDGAPAALAEIFARGRATDSDVPWLTAELPQGAGGTRYAATALQRALAASGPQHLYALQAVPPAERTTDGEPEAETPAAGDLHRVPITDSERRVAEIFQELLGVEAVQVHDNFFELGGNSLVATRVQSRLREAFGVELSLDTLFEAPTVGELASRVVNGGSGAAGLEDDGPIPSLAPDVEAPLSFPQQRLLFLSVLSRRDVSYNMPLGLHLRGPLRLVALQRALQLLVDRHESLRTRYRLARGQASQWVLPRAEVPLPVVDVAGCSSAAAEAEVRRHVQGELARPIDLFRGPLFRFLLLRLGGEEHVLLLVVHHIAADGWSSNVLFRDLVELYRDGRGGSLPELPVRYVDFAAWQRSWLDEERMERQLGYWRQRLAGLPLTEVVPDRPRRAGRTGRGAAERFSLSAEATEGLRRLARQREATLFMVLLAGFLVVLRHECGADDLVVGTDVANRTRSETENLVGLFVNQLVLREDLSGDPSLDELLARVRRTALGAFSHQHQPFEKLVEALNPVRESGRTPLFQIKLVLQNAPVEGRGPAELSVSRYAAIPVSPKFDLLMNLLEGPEGLTGRLEYDADLYEASTAQRLVEAYRIVLQAFAERPQARLREITATVAEACHRAREGRVRELRVRKSRSIEKVRRRPTPIPHRQGEPG